MNFNAHLLRVVMASFPGCTSEPDLLIHVFKNIFVTFFVKHSVCRGAVFDFAFYVAFGCIVLHFTSLSGVFLIFNHVN